MFILTKPSIMSMRTARSPPERSTFLVLNLVNSCGLYYKHMTIVNYASSIVNKLKALHTDDARVVIYDHHVFIVQATGLTLKH